MAKESGLGWTTFEVDESGGTARNIRNDCTSINWSMPRAIQDITGLDKSARETLLLLADFSFTATGVFNDASQASHDVFKTVASTSVSRTVTNVISGQTLAVECNLTDYALTRAQSGEFTWSVPGVLQSGTAPTWA
jgi:hypothetical protein